MLHSALASYLTRRNAVWPWLAQSPRANNLEFGDALPAVMLRLRYQSAPTDTAEIDAAAVLIYSIAATQDGAEFVSQILERELEPARLPIRVPGAKIVSSEVVARHRAVALRFEKRVAVRALKYLFEFERR